MKFDLSAAWSITVALLRRHQALVIPIAGVFLFLPTLIFSLSIEPMQEVTSNDGMEVLRRLYEYYLTIMPGALLVGIIALIGNLAITVLFLDEHGISVGEALKLSLVLFIPALVAMIITNIIVGAGLILLIVPGLYLLGRLAILNAVIVGENIKNPLTAVSRTWEMTKGNGWRIFLFFAIVIVIGAIIEAIISGLLNFVFALTLSADLAVTVSAFVSAFLGAVLSVVLLALYAATYLQLKGPTTSALDRTFE